jgi:hypothetical protein
VPVFAVAVVSVIAPAPALHPVHHHTHDPHPPGLKLVYDPDHFLPVCGTQADHKNEAVGGARNIEKVGPGRGGVNHHGVKLLGRRPDELPKRA